MPLLQHPWDIAPRTAKYRCVGATPEERRLLDLGGLTEFDALSIGENGRQLAIVPVDNPDASRIASIIVSAPHLLVIVKAILPLIEVLINDPETAGSFPNMTPAMVVDLGKTLETLAP